MAVRLLGAALVAFAVASSPAAAAPHPRPAPLTSQERARFTAALEALRSGDWSGAVRGFRSAAAGAAVLSDYARLFLAESLARIGEVDGARRAAEALAREEAGSLLVPQGLLLAAYLASRTGDEGGAERLLREFLSRFPDVADSARARYLLGLTLEGLGRPAEAVAVFRELWLLEPSTAYAEGAADQLVSLAGRGVVLPPPSDGERLERAERLLAAGAVATAREEAETLLARRPDPGLAFRAFRVVAQSFRRAGRYGAAAAALERSLPLAPPPGRAGLLLELAQLQERAGAHAQALATVDRLIRQFPREPAAAEALVLKGRVLETTGRVSEAVRIYAQAAAEFSDDEAAAVARWRLGWVHYLAGDLAAAAEEFGRLVGLAGGRSYRLAAAYWGGRARAALGEHAEAERLFRLLLAEAPRSYYGILAARRVGADQGSVEASPPLKLPADPLAPITGELRFLKAEALRAVGLAEDANAEIEDLQVSAFPDPVKLYGLSALWTRVEQFHLALRILRRHFARLAWSGHPGLPRQFWELFYPLSWRRELGEAAARSGLEVHLVAAVVREESSFFPNARSPAGARGLMQLMPETARGLAERRGWAFGAGDLLDEPRANLVLGAEFLARLLREFGDPRLALAAYNAGPARVRQWWAARRTEDLETFVEQIPFTETRHFVKRVLVSWEEYRRIYGAPR